MESLKSARSRNLPWDEVARAVRQMEAEGPDSSGPPPIRRAEALSGYSANQLRRMLAGLVFLDELTEANPAIAKWLGIPKFSHAEMLAKLWRRDRDTTLRLLRSEPVLRYESLSRLFNTMTASASPMSAGKRAQKSFEEKCIAVLLDDAMPFSPFGAGSYELLRPRVHNPYCRPALLLRCQTRNHRIYWSGLDFVPRSHWDDAALRQLMLIGVEARFLDLHFVVFAPGDAVEQAYRAIEDLGFGNVRIAVLDEGVMVSPPVMAEADTPGDRRSKWVPPRLHATLARYDVGE